jgi:hypothetical protein
MPGNDHKTPAYGRSLHEFVCYGGIYLERSIYLKALPSTVLRSIWWSQVTQPGGVAENMVIIARSDAYSDRCWVGTVFHRTEC